MVTINRTYLLRSFLFALLLLWPLLMFGKPSYMVDSAAYQAGGEKAVTIVARKLGLVVPPPPQAAGPRAASADDGTKVARSIVYSVLGYALGGPGYTMIYLAVFHALVVAFAVTALFQAVAEPGWRAFGVMAGVTTFATSLAPTVNFAIPDCFAGLMLAVMMVLPFYWSRFSWPIRVFLLGTAIFSVAVHSSHPPVAVGTALVALLWIFLLRRESPVRPAVATAALLAPPVLGLALVMLTGLIGFGTVSVAPKHHPLALARGIDNGPARWYLEDACRDRTRYAICEIYGTHIPATVQDLLWSPDNLIRRATPEQLDRIRAEEKTILIHAAMRYPVQQASITLHDVPEQFFTFRINHLVYNRWIARNEQGAIVYRGTGEGEVPALLEWLNGAALIAVIVSTLFLGLWWPRMTVAQRGMLLTLATGLLVNAAVCAIFSGVAPRYQARLIWLVPFAAIAIGFARGGWRPGGVATDNQSGEFIR